MKRNLAALLLFSMLSMLSWMPAWGEERVLFMCGAAAAPVADLLAKGFEAKTGIRVDVNIGGSGMLLSQIKLAKKGDVYFPGSIDFIEQARREGVIDPSTIAPVVYLVPAINVQRGNPRNIKSLKDLCRPGLRVVIANPETVCLGVFATELVDKLFSSDEKKAFRANIVNYTDSCEKTANVITMNTADAIIGWSVFEHWNPDLIETVKLDPAEVIRISYLAVAVPSCAENPKRAREFIEFMKSPEGLDCFRKFKYFTSPEDALKYLGAEKPIGGDPYQVPTEWLNPPAK
jgi:molybdate transport system substrate-binding protein